jgi:hypothetical protein
MKKYVLIVMGLFSLITLIGCSSDDKLDVPDATTTNNDKDDSAVQDEIIPEGWEKGPEGIFTLEIARDDSDPYGEWYGATIIKTPNNQSLFYCDRVVEIKKTDIPQEDWEIGKRIDVYILSYYLVPSPFWSYVIQCRIKKI